MHISDRNSLTAPQIVDNGNSFLYIILNKILMTNLNLFSSHSIFFAFKSI